jgi:hypothetical protein
LVEDPVPDTTGTRPPVTDSGWLCNGQRSPSAGTAPAMAGPARWQPPVENAANRHSVFVDVQLWNGDGDQRIWSCPYLAAVWQLLRLGLLRHEGEGLVKPAEFAPWADNDEVPDEWDRMPAIVQLNPSAKAFSAYRTFSVLASRFLPIELAVRVVLSQFYPEQVAAEQVNARSRDEGISLPAPLVDRVGYLFPDS